MAQKMVRVRYKRTMGIGADKRGPGYETEMDVGKAQEWLRNGRIELVATGKEKARPAASAADPMLAPPSGSPAGPGAVSSSSHQGRRAGKKTSKRPGVDTKTTTEAIDPFG